MNIDFVNVNTPDFDPEKYIKILIAVVKSDRFNSKPETEYVRGLANRLKVDFIGLWNDTDKDMAISKMRVSRLTAMVILKDCIELASLDGNFSLSEKELVYTYATQLDIPQSDVIQLEKWMEESKVLEGKWNDLIAAK